MSDTQLVMDALREVPALFVSELAARTRLDVCEVDAAIEHIESGEPGTLIVCAHASPDKHLVADLRVIASIRGHDAASAIAAADGVWNDWLKNLLQAHRCT